MTLFAYLNGSDVAHQVRLNDFGLATRADGSVGVGGIVFDDPAGTLNVRGWMTVVVKELACTAAPVLFSGFVFDRTYSRGPYKTGPSRIIDTNLLDQNAVLHVRLITGLDGKRPAETRSERLDWLLGSAYLDTLIDDESLVSSGAENFEEASYLGQYADDVLADISAPINRIFFVYPTQPSGGRGLFFDRSTETIGTSTISISNVLTDITYNSNYIVTGNVYPPLIDATLERDPSEVYDNGRYKYKNGVVLGHDDTTKAEFFTDNGLGSRGIAIDNSRVGQESTARTFLARILDRDSQEADTITVTIQLPPEKVGLVQAGDRMQVRFAHLEGYDPAVYSRVTARQVKQTDDNDQLYDVTLTLNTYGLSGGGGGGAPPSGEFPHPPAALSIVQTKTEVVGGSGSGDFDVTLTTAPGEGNVLVVWQTSRGVNFGTPSAGWTVHPDGVQTPGSDFSRMMYRTVGASESANVVVLSGSEPGGYSTVWEIAGVDTTPDTDGSNAVDTLVVPSSVDAGTLTPTAGTGAIILLGLAFHSSDAVGGQVNFVTPGSGFTQDAQPWADAHPLHYAASRILSLTTGSYATTQGFGGFPSNFAGWAGESLVFVAATGASAPDPGRWVYGAIPTPTPDGVTVTFTTPFPFSDGSLRVYVDRLDQTGAVVAYDGAAGTFTLAFAPKVGELVEVDFQGR